MRNKELQKAVDEWRETKRLCGKAHEAYRETVEDAVAVEARLKELIADARPDFERAKLAGTEDVAVTLSLPVLVLDGGGDIIEIPLIKPEEEAGEETQEAEAMEEDQ